MEVTRSLQGGSGSHAYLRELLEGEGTAVSDSPCHGGHRLFELPDRVDVLLWRTQAGAHGID
jgi:hypothetical protein